MNKFMSDDNRKMKWALCVGLTDLISADNPDVKKYHGRFYCPDCNQPIFFVRASNRAPNQFRHHKLEPYSPPCSRRTISSGNLIVARTMRRKTKPFPLFVKETENGSFSINIRFAPLPDGLDSFQETYVSVPNTNGKYKLGNLESDPIKRITIVPDESHQNLIFDGPANDDLKIGWGDSIDCFRNDGAFFDAISGKKIPYGDAVYTDTSYLFACIEHSNLDRIKYSSLKLLGKLDVKSGNYFVYAIRFTMCSDRETKNAVKDYGNRLTDKSSRPEIMWPPSVISEDVVNPLWMDSGLFLKTNPASNRFVQITGEAPKQYEREECGSLIKIDHYNHDFDIHITQGSDCDSISVAVDSADVCLRNVSEDKVEVVYGSSIDDFDETVCFKTDFIKRIAISPKSGLDRMVSSETDCKIKTECTRISVYNYHFGLVYQHQTHNRNSVRKEESLFLNLRSGDRVPVPSWLDHALIRYSSIYPTEARMIKASCFDGSISRHVLELIQQWS